MSHSPESRKGGHKNADDPKVIQLGVNISLGGNSTSDVEVFVNDRKQPCGQLTAPTLSPSKHASSEIGPGEDSAGKAPIIEGESPCKKSQSRSMDKTGVTGGGSERDESWKGSRCEDATIVDEIESAIDSFDKFSEHVKDIPRLSTRRLCATSTPHHAERTNSRSEGNLSSFSYAPRSYVPKHDFRDGKYFRKAKPTPGDLFLKPLPGDDYFKKGFVRRYRRYDPDPYRHYTSVDDLARFYEYGECGSVVAKATESDAMSDVAALSEATSDKKWRKQGQKGEGSEAADKQSTSSESAKDIKIYQSGGIIIMQNFSETADLIDNSGETSKKLLESCNRVRERIESIMQQQQQSSDESQKPPHSSSDDNKNQSTGKFVQFDLSSCSSETQKSMQVRSATKAKESGTAGASQNQDFPSLSTQDDSVVSNPPGASPTSSACGKKLEWDSGADVGYANAGKENMSTIERIILRGLSGEDSSSKAETSQVSRDGDDGPRTKRKSSNETVKDSSIAENVSSRRTKSKHHATSKKSAESTRKASKKESKVEKPSCADKSTYVDTLFNEFCLELPLDDVMGSEEESGLSESSDRSPVVAKRLTKRRGTTRRSSAQQTNLTSRLDEMARRSDEAEEEEEEEEEKDKSTTADQMIQTTEPQVESKSVQALESRKCSPMVTVRESPKALDAFRPSKSVQAADATTSSLPKHLAHPKTSVEQPNTKATQFFGGPATSLPNFRSGVKDPRAKILNDRLNEEENRRNARKTEDEDSSMREKKGGKASSRRSKSDPENKENHSTDAEEISKRSSLRSKRSESAAFGSCDVQPSEDGGIESSYITSEMLKERGDSIDRSIIQEMYFESQLRELRDVETRGTSPDRRQAAERDTQTSFSRASVSCQYSPQQSDEHRDDRGKHEYESVPYEGKERFASLESSAAAESMTSSSQTAHSWMPGVRLRSKSRRFTVGRALSFEYLPGHVYENGNLESKQRSATLDDARSPSRVVDTSSSSSSSPSQSERMKESESGNTVVLENTDRTEEDEVEAEVVDSGHMKTLDNNLTELEVVVSRLHEKEAVFQRITESVLATMLTGGKESGDSSRGTGSAAGSRFNSLEIEEVCDVVEIERKSKKDGSGGGEEISTACQTDTIASNAKFYEERTRLEQRMTEEKEQQIKWIENEINHLNMLRSLLEKQEDSNGSGHRRKRHHYLTEAKEGFLVKKMLAESLSGDGAEGKELEKLSESTSPESCAIRTVKELSGKPTAQFGMALSVRRNNLREVTMLPVGVQVTVRDVKIMKNLSDLSSTDSRSDIAGFQSKENLESRCTCVKCNEGKCMCLQPGEGAARKKSSRTSERYRGAAGSSLLDGEFSRSEVQVPSSSSMQNVRAGSVDIGSRTDIRSSGPRGFPEAASAVGSTLDRCQCMCHAQPLPRCDDCNLLNTCKNCRCYRKIKCCTCNRAPKKFGSTTSPRRFSSSGGGGGGGGGGGVGTGTECQLCRCSSGENQACALCPCHVKQTFSLTSRGMCRCKKKFKERSCQTDAKDCKCCECNDAKKEEDLYRETKYMTESTREVVEREPSVVVMPSEGKLEVEKKQSVDEKFSFEMKVPLEKRCACHSRPLQTKNLTGKARCRCKGSKTQKKKSADDHPRHYFLQVEETTEDESSGSCDNGNALEVITIRVPIRKLSKSGSSSPQRKMLSGRGKRPDADACGCCENCTGRSNKKISSQDRARDSGDCNCCEACQGYVEQVPERPQDSGAAQCNCCEDCNGYAGKLSPLPEKSGECECCPDCKGSAPTEDARGEEGEYNCCEDCAGRGRSEAVPPRMPEDAERQAQRSRSAGSTRGSKRPSLESARPAFGSRVPSAESARPSSGSGRAFSGSRRPSTESARPSSGSGRAFSGSRGRPTADNCRPPSESGRQTAGSRVPPAAAESPRPPSEIRVSSAESARPPSESGRQTFGSRLPSAESTRLASESGRQILGSRVPSAESARPDARSQEPQRSRMPPAETARWPSGSNKDAGKFPRGDDAGECNCCEGCAGHPGPVPVAEAPWPGPGAGRTWQPQRVTIDDNCNCCDECQGRKYAPEEREPEVGTECNCCAGCPGRSDTGDSSAYATQEENTSASDGDGKRKVTEAGENLPPIREEKAARGGRAPEKSKNGAEVKVKKRSSRSKAGDRGKRESPGKSQRKCPPGCKPCQPHPGTGKTKTGKSSPGRDKATKDKCRGSEYYNFNKREYMTKSELEREEKKKQRPSRLTLQECLTVKRPDLYTRAECRRKIISEKTRERVDRHQKRMECLTKLLPQCDIPGNAPELKLFTSAEMKKQTRKFYKNLPEVANKAAEEKKAAEFRTNKLLAEIFAKKLQLRTLKGCVNLSNSFTVMSTN